MTLTAVEEGSRSELDIQRPVISVGRAVDNDIRLTGTLVSRHHCRIEVGPEGAWVVDLGSANGTSVNGQKVSRRLLEPGDRIQIGGARVQLRLEEAGAEAASRPHEPQPIELEPDLAPVGARTLTGDPRAH